MSPARSTSRNSLLAAPLGSKLNDTRKPSISGLGWTIGALTTAPALASTRASGKFAGRVGGKALEVDGELDCAGLPLRAVDQAGARGVDPVASPAARDVEGPGQAVVEGIGLARRQRLRWLPVGNDVVVDLFLGWDFDELDRAWPPFFAGLDPSAWALFVARL